MLLMNCCFNDVYEQRRIIATFVEKGPPKCYTGIPLLKDTLEKTHLQKGCIFWAASTMNVCNASSHQRIYFSNTCMDRIVWQKGCPYQRGTTLPVCHAKIVTILVFVEVHTVGVPVGRAVSLCPSRRLLVQNSESVIHVLRSLSFY